MSHITKERLLREEAAKEGERIYEQDLKSLIEPSENGKFVAIHTPSGDYALGETLIDATDQLRKRWPEAVRGEVYARGVGRRTLVHARTPRGVGIHE
ncbi:MAG: hypothetical protein QF473_28060 [Planctomycetota bacterium]|nr:hypothetical protein [Planctomycetota bacterium]